MTKSRSEEKAPVVWKIGDAESTARVAAQTGISMEALNKMADNFFRTRIPWLESDRVD